MTGSTCSTRIDLRPSIGATTTLPKLAGRSRRLWGHIAAAAHGWRLFPTLVDTDVADAVLELVAHPGSIAERMDRVPSTLIHGEALRRIAITKEVAKRYTETRLKGLEPSGLSG